MTKNQQDNYNKIAVAVLNGLKLTAAAKLFYAELSDIYESTDEKKLFNKCRHLVHEFCKFRNGDEYEVCKINAAHGGAQDVYMDSLAFDRCKFLTKKEMLDYSYLGDAADLEIAEIEAMKEESIADGISARTAIKCAKKIMENQVRSIPSGESIDNAINNLKIAKKQAKKGTMDLFAVVEAFECILVCNDTSIATAKGIMKKHS